MIRNIVLDELITITHVGSTAVPGLVAKPIIDILIIVEDINKLNGSILYLKKKTMNVVGRTGFQVDVFIIKAMVQSMFMHLMKEVMIKLNSNFFL